MQKITYTCVYGLALIFSTINHAEQFYIGTDISHMTLDQVEFDAVNVKSLLAGYTFEKWSIESSYNTSITDNRFYGGDQKIKMFHLYGVYRSQGDLYSKMKLGITNERYQFYDNDGYLKLDDVHTGIARGIGVGYRYGQFNIELEYSWLGQSLEMAGIGIRYNFN
ncbi:MAG: hypothetical protein ACSHW0_03215 [Thalassotalea sp.]